MDQQLKQRLVGVTVIFSLAVIFLPMLLDGSGDRPKHLEISIPTPPKIPSYVTVEDKVIELTRKVEKLPQLEAIIVDEIADQPVVQKSTSKTEKLVVAKQNNKSEAEAAVIKSTEAQAKPVPPVKTKVPVEVSKKPVKKQTGGTSWVIQAGSFSDKAKAYKLRDKLRKSGLASVFIEKFKHNGVLNYRVRMGPFISRNKARVIGNKVRAKYNIKGLVMHYEK